MWSCIKCAALKVQASDLLLRFSEVGGLNGKVKKRNVKLETAEREILRVPTYMSSKIPPISIMQFSVLYQRLPPESCTTLCSVQSIKVSACQRCLSHDAPPPYIPDGRVWGNCICCLFYHWQAFWGDGEQRVSIEFHPQSSLCSFSMCLQLCLKLRTIISRHQFCATSWQFCMMSPFICFKGDDW